MSQVIVIILFVVGNTYTFILHPRKIMIDFRKSIPEYQPPKPFVSFPCSRLDNKHLVKCMCCHV